MYKFLGVGKNRRKGGGEKMKKKYIILGILACVVSLYLIVSKFPVAYALSQYGSSGEEVKQIQTKLKDWGYYNGSVDGIYGSGTYEAVKKFQSSNGLTADGVSGTQTLLALGINSGGSQGSGSSSNNNDLNLLSHLVYGEARGEPYVGMVAVAASVMNRVSDSRFPNSISGVIYQSGAYTCVADGQINLGFDDNSKKAAQDAINGWDPTSGCIYYFNPNTATSAWIWSRPQVLTIGKHIFCK